LGGLLAVLLISLPFDSLKTVADGLSKDGNLQSFTLARLSEVKIPLGLAGIFLILAGILLAIWRKQSILVLTAFLTWIRTKMGTLRTDGVDLAKSLGRGMPGKVYLFSFLVIFLLGILARVVMVNGPVYHDEAFTFVEYASHSLLTVVTDYSLPNNHVFHTIFVHFAYLLFGDAPWAIRLPALIAGILVIPAVFLLGRLLYNKKVGLLAAALVVPIPNMIHYSSSARGYSLVTLLSLLTFGLGVYAVRKKNLAAWLLLAVISALGFYTIPIMLYPFGILFTWLFFTAFTQSAIRVYGSSFAFLKYVVIAGLLSIGLALTLYTPIFLVSGLKSVFANHVIASNSFPVFFANFLNTLGGIWESWLSGHPSMGWVLILGFILSLVFHRRIASVQVPVQIAAVLFPVAALVIQRPDSIARAWSFLLPFIVIWTAAGILAPFGLVRKRLANRFDLTQIVLAIGIAGALSLALINGIKSLPEFIHPSSPMENIALYLKDEIQEGDVISVTSPYDMSVIYYLIYHDVSKKYIKDIAEQPFDRVFVVVYPDLDQTLESVLENTGIGAEKMDLKDAETPTTVGNALIYACYPVE
jgi:hypothetical protein